MDSSPLFLQRNPKEVIKTSLKLTPSLARDNLLLRKEVAEERNTSPLVVKVSDYYTDNIQMGLKHVNNLLANGSNLFLIARYTELFLDNHGVVDFGFFKDLSIENVVDVTKLELDLLLTYIDWGFYTRLETIRYLAKLINSKADIKTYIDPEGIKYKRPPLKARDEFLITNRSLFLSIPDARKLLINPNSNINPISLIDLEGFYDVDLTKSESEQNETNLRKKNKIVADLHRRLSNFLMTLGKGPMIKDKLNTDERKKVDEMISSNIKLLEFGKKVRELVHIELERLKSPKESMLFSRPIVAAGLDASETKVKFYFEYSKLCEFSEVQITLPRIMSYKLGVSKNLDTQKYNKISIGPISMATKFFDTATTGISFNIKSDKQRLSAPIRLIPKLLVVSTDFLSEQSRQAEKEIVFFRTDDMVNFFKAPLKQKELNRQFLAIDTSLSLNQPFYRVHKARTFLSSFKVNLRDESGELLSFSRDTIVKMNFFFRACNVDRM